jgi:calpain-7
VDLKLSDSQKEIFAGWRRPLDASDSGEQETVNDASIMTAAHELDLVQDITTDCSVVASLCASAARANKGHAKVFSPLLV